MSFSLILLLLNGFDFVTPFGMIKPGDIQSGEIARPLTKVGYCAFDCFLHQYIIGRANLKISISNDCHSECKQINDEVKYGTCTMQCVTAKVEHVNMEMCSKKCEKKNQTREEFGTCAMKCIEKLTPMDSYIACEKTCANKEKQELVKT